MMKLKFHEKKLLRKADFLDWKGEQNHREVLRNHRYNIVERDDCKKHVAMHWKRIYSGVCLMAQKLTNILKRMDRRDPSLSY